MASLLLTVDNESPLIKYEGSSWSHHNIQTDPSTDSFGANLFHRMTFSRTQSPTGTLKFEFEGVDVTIYGSRNTGHGDFLVNLDDQSYTGHGAGTPTLQIPVFSANKSLSPGKHTMIISNQGNSTFVIDYLTWISNVNSNKTGFPFMNVVDDTDPAFQYKGNWSSPTDVNLFYNVTGQLTSESDSTAVFTFAMLNLSRSHAEGDAVAIYGSVGPENGPYSVQLDNEPPEQYSASTKTYAVKSLLYYRSNIGEGNHSLTIMNRGPENFEIDYANLYTLSLDSLAYVYQLQVIDAPNSALDVFSLSQTQTSDNPSALPRLPAGAIAGISVAAAFVVILMFVAGYSLGLRRQRKNISQQKNEYAIQSPFTLQSSQTQSSRMGSSVNDSTLVPPFPLSIPMPDNSKAAYEVRSARSNSPLEISDNAEIFRIPTLRSDISMTASTLIAENGSTIQSHLPQARRSRRKPGYAKGTKSFNTKQAFMEAPREESDYDAASETGSLRTMRSGATSTLFAP